MYSGGGRLLLFILQDLVYCALSKCQHCRSNSPIKPNPCCWALPVFISADRRAQSPHTRVHPPIHPFTHPSLITSSHSLALLCSLSPYRSLCPPLWHILCHCWCFLFCLVWLPAPISCTCTNTQGFFASHNSLCFGGDLLCILIWMPFPNNLFSLLFVHMWPFYFTLSTAVQSDSEQMQFSLALFISSNTFFCRPVPNCHIDPAWQTVPCWSCLFLIAFSSESIDPLSVNSCKFSNQ